MPYGETESPFSYQLGRVPFGNWLFPASPTKDCTCKGIWAADSYKLYNTQITAGGVYRNETIVSDFCYLFASFLIRRYRIGIQGQELPDIRVR